MIRSRTSERLLVYLKRLPSNGISFNIGTPISVSTSSSVVRPPITEVCPLLTIT